MEPERERTVVTREGGPAPAMIIAAAAIIGVVLLVVLLFAFAGRGPAPANGNGGNGGNGAPGIQQEDLRPGNGGTDNGPGADLEIDP